MSALIKVFITNLGKYNEGELIGEWVDLPITEEELDKVYERIGINEDYEEIFITDYETPFFTTIDEWESITDLNDLAEALESLDEYDLENGYEDDQPEENQWKVCGEIVDRVVKIAIRLLKNSYSQCMKEDIVTLLDYLKFELDTINENQ